MIITSSSLSTHTFLKIANAAAGIIPVIDVLYVCIYMHIMYVFIYRLMYILNLDFCQILLQ